MFQYHYVKSNEGNYAVALFDPVGFLGIITVDRVFPAGIGWASRWEPVDLEDIPADVRKELDRVVQDRVDRLKFIVAVTLRSAFGASSMSMQCN
jgi:hypothetical protein